MAPWMKRLSPEELEASWVTFKKNEDTGVAPEKNKARCFGTVIINPNNVSEVPVATYPERPDCVKVCLVSRWTEGRHVFVGGECHRDTDESFYGAFQREFLEEVGIAPPAADPYSAYVYSCDWNEKLQTYACHLFVRVLDGDAGTQFERDAYCHFPDRVGHSETCGLSFFEARMEMEKDTIEKHHMPSLFVHAFDNLLRADISSRPDISHAMRLQFVLFLVHCRFLSLANLEAFLTAVHTYFEGQMRLKERNFLLSAARHLLDPSAAADDLSQPRANAPTGVAQAGATDSSRWRRDGSRGSGGGAPASPSPSPTSSNVNPWGSTTPTAGGGGGGAGAGGGVGGAGAWRSDQAGNSGRRQQQPRSPAAAPDADGWVVATKKRK